MSRIPLVPCASCRRHVRASEAHCPFCRTARAATFAPPAVTPRVTSRAAMFVVGATLSLAACGPMSTVTDTPAPTDDGGPVARYGAPPPPEDDGGPVARYGAPPPPADASPPPADVAPPPEDDGGPVARYGAPPPPEDAGNPMTRYGAPPPEDAG